MTMNHHRPTILIIHLPCPRRQQLLHVPPPGRQPGRDEQLRETSALNVTTVQYIQTNSNSNSCTKQRPHRHPPRPLPLLFPVVLTSPNRIVDGPGTGTGNSTYVTERRQTLTPAKTRSSEEFYGRVMHAFGRPTHPDHRHRPA